jgi:hypothetical protein
VPGHTAAGMESNIWAAVRQATSAVEAVNEDKTGSHYQK